MMIRFDNYNVGTGFGAMKHAWKVESEHNNFNINDSVSDEVIAMCSIHNVDLDDTMKYFAPVYEGADPCTVATFKVKNPETGRIAPTKCIVCHSKYPRVILYPEFGIEMYASKKFAGRRRRTCIITEEYHLVSTEVYEAVTY